MSEFEAVALPPELCEFLALRDRACLTIPTDDGTVIVAKTPTADIDSCRGRVKILVSQELFNTSHGPVLRLLLTIHDQPERPLCLEAFCNIADPSQFAEYQDLLSRPVLRVLFYDEQVVHRLSKLIPQPLDNTTKSLLPTALKLLKRTAPDMLDYDKAKQIIQDEVPF
jgi:hypothetical protein